MELELRPSGTGPSSLDAVLIKGASVEHWLHELQRMDLSLAATAVYPLPGTVANSVGGCLAVYPFGKTGIDIGRNGYCQLLHRCLFIPERASLHPTLSAEETAKLLGGKLHLLHPETGLVALEEKLDWATVISLPEPLPCRSRKPAPSAPVPQGVKTFLVKPVAAEETLQNFEETNFPKPQKFSDKPLNPFEKGKLFLYRRFFTKKGQGEDGTAAGIERTPLLSKLGGLRKLFSKKESDWPTALQKDYEELERRNQKHLDRLMELLKNDPSEALKYAIPLDNDGTGRGGPDAAFTLQKRWADFSLFGHAGGVSGGGSVAFTDDTYNQLHQQYTATAQGLIAEGDYRRAAFVYLKLLKNYNAAAETLEKGKLYAEAASVYLKYCHNKAQAADCFEKGRITEAAIELHKELNNDEKVGDLYLSLQKKTEAFHHYRKVADGYTQNHQYLKAALLYKKKMEDGEAAQQTLLRGWRLGGDSFNCLNNYFASFSDEKALGEAMETIYRNEVNAQNRETFLRVLQHEYAKENSLAQPVKDRAYEIVAAAVKDNPDIVSELRSFNKADKQLPKDTLRFKVKAKKG